MLYRTIKTLIDLGRTHGLAEKLDVLYTLGRLSSAEYAELTAILAG